MRSDRHRLSWLIVITAMLATLAAPSFAQDEDEGDEGSDTSEAPRAKPVLRAGTLSPEDRRSFSLDGHLAESAWSKADSIPDLIQVEPEEGAEPTARTVVRVLTNAHELIIGIQCYDAPDGIVSFSKARDSDLGSEDHILLILDTFGDNRSGYVFSVNPTGARLDGLLTSEGDEANTNWDTVWEAATAIHGQGWSAEVRIPIKSLSFSKGLEGWGLNVQRRVQRLQEVSRWSGASQDYEIYTAIHAGQLTGLPEFDLGLGLTIKPSFVLEADRPMPDLERKFKGDASVDVLQRLGPNLNATLTVNTDFGETDVDVRQTNLGRFELLFPEKRSFFVDGADIFEFGIGTGIDDANVLPFFTRRIGLFFGDEDSDFDGSEVPILAGGKIQGRVGETNIGGVVVATDKVDAFGLPEATMGAVRLRQNVLTESSAGVIATFGDPLGRKDSWLAGADFTYRTSEFMNEKNLVAGVWGLTTDRDGLSGDKTAVGGKIAYPNDLFDAGLTYLKIGDDFDPALGFVQREGHVIESTIEYDPRPTWSLVRQQFYEFDGFLSLLSDGDWQSFNMSLIPLNWQFESGDAIELSVAREGDRPDEEFDVFASQTKEILIPPGPYRWNRYGFAGTFAGKRKVSGTFGATFGSFYEGHLDSYEGSIIIKPIPVLTLSGDGECNVGRLPQGDFTQWLGGVRAELKVSPDFQVSNFFQYDNESGEFGSATRLRWTFHPLGDLFFAFNHNILREVVSVEEEASDESEHDVPTMTDWRFQSDQIVIKVQYAFRM